jgi:hypothetical protein
MFMKNPDAVIGPGDTIQLPACIDPRIFMHEAELALVMKGLSVLEIPEADKQKCSGAMRARSRSLPRLPA